MSTADSNPDRASSPIPWYDYHPDMEDFIESYFLKALDAGIEDPEGKGPTLGHLMAALNITHERNEHNLWGYIYRKWKAYNEKHPAAALELRRAIAGAITWDHKLYVIDLPEDCPPITEWTEYDSVKIVEEPGPDRLKLYLRFELQVRGHGPGTPAQRKEELTPKRATPPPSRPKTEEELEYEYETRRESLW